MRRERKRMIDGSSRGVPTARKAAPLVAGILALALLCGAWLVYAMSATGSHLVLHPHVRYGEAAFIAGASEGLGAAWADYLAALGFNLVIVARHADTLHRFADSVRARHNVSVDAFTLDLADEAAAMLAARLFRERADIGLVVYNAAYTGADAGYFALDSLAAANTAIDVNVRGVLSIVHPFLQCKQERGETGGVVLMSSMAGVVGSAHITTYAATKAWNTAFATGLYEELRPMGIDVLACLAGATTTPNYLERANPTRSRWIEQRPADVVRECASALGRVPTRATGAVNRIGELLLGRLLPTGLAVRMMSDGTRGTTAFARVDASAN